MNLDRPVAPNPYDLLPEVASFTVVSDSLTDGADLPDRHAFAHDNQAPHLSWSGAPAETASYVVTCFDPDAPTPSGFWHWAVIGIPADVSELPAGAALPSGAVTVPNDFGTREYAGAAPPPGDRPHRYLFAVHALDTADLGLDDSASPAKVSFTMLEHVLARAVITGKYAVEA